MFFSQRVLAVVWSKGNLGSSYYDTETSQLYLQMDVVETNDFQFLKRGNYWNRFEFTLYPLRMTKIKSLLIAYQYHYQITMKEALDC